ncbi:Fe-S cluster assembly protein SufD [bacterium]|nr:Fe-S cluster assembly protein SufD [bacterium]
MPAPSASQETPAAFDRDALDHLISAHPLPAWVAERRLAAFDAFSGLALPDRRSENWMRTDLRLFKPRAWGLRPEPAAMPVPQGLLTLSMEPGGQARFAGQTEPVPNAGRVLSLDGHVLRDELDPALAKRGVVFGSAERVLAEHGDAIRPHWFSVIDSRCDWFAALHATFHRASSILYVPPGVKVAEPLSVLAAITPGGVDTSHVLVVLGEGAEATLLTETSGGGEAASPAAGFHCGGTEIVVGKGAFLRIVNLQNWNTGVWHFARQKAVVHENGRLQWTLGALGSRVSQVAQDVALAGRHADAQVNGVMFTEGRQHLVYNTLQHHEAPACKSDLLYKGALQDRSRLVWRGMIKVDKAAQKTDGYQRNDNLMLSNEARADSIPGLEIEADDVRCTHGATSGRVDAEQIFYAQARGLTADEAARLVVAGFFQQVFDRITILPVREALARAIGSRIRRVS